MPTATLHQKQNNPDVTVLICTWNRVADLLNALKALSLQTFSLERFEVIVVDNNSTDNTAQAVKEMTSQAPYRLHYISETRQGKSHALNAGIGKAAASIIACTDDDCRPAPDWLEQGLKSFDNPDVGILGGPGLSVFPESVQQDPKRMFLAQRFLGDFQPFDEFSEVTDKNPPLGLNLWFRKEVAQAAGGFDTNLGPTGKKHLCREETAFVRGAQAAGYRVFFNPSSIVHHHIAEDRITWRAIKKQAFDSGIGTFRERYAARVGTSYLRKLTCTLTFMLEMLYSWLRMMVFVFKPNRRIVAHFRAVAAAGKLSGLWGKS